MPPVRVMIVDDSADARFLLRAIIEDAGGELVVVGEADGARAALEADFGVGITGVAGPGGGTPDKPVGLVWLSVAGAGEGGVARLTRSINLPGNRADIRDRATTVAMHMVRRLLVAPGDGQSVLDHGDGALHT